MTSISESLKLSEQDLLSKGEEEAQKVQSPLTPAFIACGITIPSRTVSRADPSARTSCA